MLSGLLIGVFLVGYLFVTLEHKTGINKAAFALLMGVACWGLIFVYHHELSGEILLQLNEHLADISQVVIFLLGAMTIVELVDSYHGFRLITNFIQTKSKKKLLCVVSFITFFLSAVLDNMTTAIVMVSLMRRLIPDKDDKLIFSSMIIIAANAGGAWSPIGDVTTTMLWIGGQISSGGIVRRLFFPSLISTLIPLIYFLRFLKNNTAVSSDAKKEEPSEPGTRRVFFLGIGALIFVPILRALTGMPPYMGILLGLGAMWVLTDLIHQERHFLRISHILTKIDISSVLFFLGILLTISALEVSGILQSLASWLDHYVKGKDLIVTLMGLLSAIIDNVPLTAAAMGMYDLTLYPMDSKIWEMIAYCAGTGGSILIIGSAAGVVVMGMEKITFGWYSKRVSIPALIGYLSGVFVYLTFYH